MSLTELESELRQVCSQPQWQWFIEKRSALEQSDQVAEYLAIIMAMAKRKVGSEVLADQWTCDEAARVLFVAKAQELNPSTPSAIVERAFQQGDEYEREAILKGLPLLDTKGELLKLAEEACRTNIHTLFTAISQHNTYPDKYFDEGAFNQMVLKSLFLDINIEPILGLVERVNPSLSRMCYDYLQERLAADRTLPTSIWLTLRLEWVEQAANEFTRFLSDDDEQHRYYVALSLSQQVVSENRVSENMLRTLRERVKIETNPDILALLQSHLKQQTS